MWLVTKIGFFNIIQYDEDKADDLLTIKARSKEDLLNTQKYLPDIVEIEESSEADYRFRLKAPKLAVAGMIAALVEGIDYRLTKPSISKSFPERARLYFNVWDTLYHIQEIDVTKERLRSSS